MTVLLIQPPNSYENEAWKYDNIPDCPPLGLLLLGAELEGKGIEFDICDGVDGSFPLEEMKKKLLPEVGVIGITSMTANIRGAVQVAEYIRQHSNAKIILGGSHVSADPEIINRYECFDYGIIREGDVTFPKLVRSIENGTDKTDYPSPIIEGEIPEDLNKLPLPKWDAIDWSYYKNNRGFWTNAVFASRGCPYVCSFCSIPAIAKTVRYNSPERVVEEMEFLLKINGIKYFTFVDDLFTLNKKWVIEVCKAIIDSGLNKKITWNAQARINTVNDEVLGWMKQAGCYNLVFGVESGSERIREQVIGKRLKNQAVIDVTRLCKAHDIEADWYLMLGFHSETRADMEDTINLPLKAEPNIIGIHITTPLPGAPLWDQVISDKQLPPDTIDRYIRGELGPYFKGCWPYYIPEGFTLQELVEIRDEGYKRFYRRVKYILYRLKRDYRSWEKLKQDARHLISLLRFGASDDDKTVLNDWHSVHTVGGWYDKSKTETETEKVESNYSAVSQQREEALHELAIYDPDDAVVLASDESTTSRP